MNDLTNVAPSDAGSTGAAPVTPPPAAPANDGPMSFREAGRALASRREELRKERAAQAAPPAQPDAAPAPENELADEANAAPLEEVPGEIPSEADPVETLPPIEPPRSWTKEKKEAFASLPRDLQEYVAESARRQDTEFRRSQNEAAERQKALEAEREATAKGRQQYEEALPALLQTLHAAQNGEFADIRTMADVQRMAAEDPFRYTRWDLQQKQLQYVQQQVVETQSRQEQEKSQRFEEFAKKEDELLKDYVPELSDPVKAQALGNSAIETLKSLDFSDQELAKLWSGQANISLRDHRVQRLILDGVKYRDAQANKAALAKKPLPPVQRPGVAQPRGAAAQAQVQALINKAEQTGNLKDSVAALIARRKATARTR